MTTRPTLIARATEIPPGMDIKGYLKQGELWATPDGMVKITDMTPDHKRHAVRWLQDNATGLILVTEASLNEDIVTGDAPDGLSVVLALMNIRPKEWVTSTALYKALSA